jgi:hypothetical protein
MGNVLGLAQRRWVAEKLGKLIRRRGELVEDSHYEARREKCEACDHYGEVMPLPGLFFMGCTICSCPLETKCRMKVLMRTPELHGTPLSVKEIIMNPTTGEHLRPEVVRCSNHLEIDFWKEVDNNY